MKVVFVGATRSGKTSIIQRLMFQTYQYRYKPTVEDHFKLDATLPDGESLVLHIADTSGTDEFPVMRDLRIRQAEVFVVVYAVDSQASFQYAIRMCHNIKEIKENQRAPIILVGNKTDLSSERTLTYEDGYQLMKSLETCFFIETSARLGDHIDYILDLLAVEVDSKNGAYMNHQLIISSRANYVTDRSVSMISQSEQKMHSFQVKSKRKRKRKICCVM